jgi:sugar phosphate isomerase/epimerase
MRLRHPDGSTVHLAYCTNVHPAEDFAGVLRQLAEHAEPVRELLGVPRLGLGLWLAAGVARELATDEAALGRLRRELAARGLEVVTLNGFPYRGFHEPVVKRAVYLPDWSDPARLAYTLDLAKVLAGLLPEDAARGSISSLPLAWRLNWTDEQHGSALRALDALAEGLAKQAYRTGRPVRVGLEPEPGCAVGTVQDACRLLSGLDTDQLGVCLDTCHLAVDFEEPGAALRALAAAGLPVVKVQLANALQADHPTDPAVREALAGYAEPRFLHQTRALRPQGGGLARWDDLDLALRSAPEPGARPWRVHFHLPLHQEPPAPLSSTRPVLAAAIRELTAGPRPLTDHLEVETYTWSVLPGARGVALAPLIAAELDWARQQLLRTGLTAVEA